MSHHNIREKNTPSNYGLNIAIGNVSTARVLKYSIKHKGKEYRFWSYREFTRFCKKNNIN